MIVRKAKSIVHGARMRPTAVHSLVQVGDDDLERVESRRRWLPSFVNVCELGFHQQKMNEHVTEFIRCVEYLQVWLGCAELDSLSGQDRTSRELRTNCRSIRGLSTIPTAVLSRG